VINARACLSDWLPEDPDDVPIPQEWLVAQQQQGTRASLAKTVKSNHDAKKNATGNRNHGGLMASTRQAVGRVGKVVIMPPGLRVQVLGDVDQLLSACRGAGIGTAHDHFRRIAAGQIGQVLEQDEVDGTVKVHIPDVGDIWFACAALLGNEDKDEGSTTVSEKSITTTIETLERRVHDLENEVDHGKRTVAEAVSAVTELTAKLNKAKNERKAMVGKFQLVRHRASVLVKDNRAHRDRMQQGSARLKALTVARDQAFDKAKVTLEENQTLEANIALAEKGRARQGHTGSRSREASGSPEAAARGGGANVSRSPTRGAAGADGWAIQPYQRR